MNYFFQHIKKLDWVLIGSAALLVCLGLTAIWSTGLAKDDFFNFQKQIVFFIIGLVLMLLVSFFDYRILKNNSYLVLILFFVALILIAGTIFFGVTVKGSARWYKVGFLTLDPFELIKIALVVLLAKYFSARHVEMYRFRHILLSGLYAFLPAALVFIRPDLGGAIVLVLIWLGMLLVSGIRLKHFLILVLCFALLSAAAWGFVLKDYQKERVVSFVFPHDVLGSAWNQIQSTISIGSGRIFGEGIGSSSQVQYGFLPEPHTDFIFSVIAAEWGIIGVLILFALFLVLIWRILKIAARSHSNFPRLFAVGFAIILMSQFLINVGMNLSLMPVVGIYLPFVSYGGSGIIANFVLLGIVLNIRSLR